MKVINEFISRTFDLEIPGATFPHCSSLYFKAKESTEVRRKLYYILEVCRQRFALYEAQYNNIQQEADNDIGLVMETNLSHTDMRRGLFPNNWG